MYNGHIAMLLMQWNLTNGFCMREYSFGGGASAETSNLKTEKDGG
jgi:hypothetical protein